MTELAKFAAESWWHLFVVAGLISLCGGFVIGASSAFGRSFAALATSLAIAIAAIKEKMKGDE